MSERESRDRLNAALRERGYEVCGDLVVARPKWSETREVRPTNEVVMAMSTAIGEAFDLDGASIERFNKNPIVLCAHDYEGLPVARAYFTYAGKMVDKKPTLSAKLNFHRDTELSREVWDLVKDVDYVGWELGVIPTEWDFNLAGARILVTKWDVVEISAVPSEECAEEIRCRIKDRRISSPAILRSVAAEPKNAEPTKVDKTDKIESRAPCGRNEFDECVGPYRYDWESGPHGSATWTVYGPGFERKVECREDAGARVDELNEAWRRGRESAAEERAPTRPEAPEEDDIEARLSEVEERVAEVADAVISINRRLRLAAVRLRNPPVMRRWGDGPEEEEAGG